MSENYVAPLMADLNLTEYATYEEFAETWDAPDADTRMLWQLLGQLKDDEVLIQLPEWLAEENVGYVDGATPTAFVGRIERETEKAILLGDSADARSLMKLAHRMHQLEEGNASDDSREWLDDRLADHRRAFEEREDVVTLQDEWLPKSQILHAVRRFDADS